MEALVHQGKPDVIPSLTTGETENCIALNYHHENPTPRPQGWFQLRLFPLKVLRRLPPYCSSEVHFVIGNRMLRGSQAAVSLSNFTNQAYKVSSKCLNRSKDIPCLCVVHLDG